MQLLFFLQDKLINGEMDDHGSKDMLVPAFGLKSNDLPDLRPLIRRLHLDADQFWCWRKIAIAMCGVDQDIVKECNGLPGDVSWQEKFENGNGKGIVKKIKKVHGKRNKEKNNELEIKKASMQEKKRKLEKKEKKKEKKVKNKEKRENHLKLERHASG